MSGTAQLTIRVQLVGPESDRALSLLEEDIGSMLRFAGAGDILSAAKVYEVARAPENA
jgi:hypothetical protein